MVQVSETTEQVEQSNLERREHWKKRIEYFAGIGDRGCSWTRESFESDLRELRTEVKQADNRIGELEKSISGKLDQIRTRLESYDEVTDAGLENLESKKLADNGYATHSANKEEVFGGDWPESVDEDTLIGLHRKKAVFQEIKSTLRKIGVSKVEQVALGYKKDFVSGEVADTVQEDVLNRVDKEFEKLELMMDNKLSTAVSDLESKVKVVNSRLNQLEKSFDGQVTDLDDASVDVSSVDGSGHSITETEKSISEYSLSGKGLEEQHQVLQRMAENEDVLELDLKDIVEKTDVDEDELLGDGGILDDVEEEFGTRFGIVGG